MGNFSVADEIISSSNIDLILKQLIGKSRVFVGHDSITINYSVPGLHDDQSTYRHIYGDGEIDKINSVRVLFNLNSSNSMPQRFGFVKGSHLRNSHKIDHAYCESNIKWVEVSHGSAVFFDPRIVHSADALTHSKVMVVLTYDLESKQVEQVYDYTFEDRGQGVGPNSLLWKKLQKHNLTPKFIIERET